MGENKDVPAKLATKRGRDVTRTVRQVAHLQRLEHAKGKRVVIDLDAAARQALEDLIEAKYGESQAAVIRRALIEAATKEAKTLV